MRGTVTKKKNRWYIVYYIGKDSNGKWKQKWEGSWDTKREAERVLRSRIEEVENTFDRKADKSTLAVFLRHWLSAYCVPKLAPNTVNATLMLRNRIPAKIVSAMLGHSSIGITMDTYSHVMTDMQEGAIDVMDGLLKGLY